MLGRAGDAWDPIVGLDPNLWLQAPHGRGPTPRAAQILLEPMNQESVIKAVEMADLHAFRLIARRYLELRGYHEVTLTDGPRDGGTDFLVRTLGGNKTPLAIAMTTQAKGLPGKLRSDCMRAKGALGLENVVFISSHKLANLDMTKVVDDLWEKHNTRVNTVDARAIAAAFVDGNEVAFVLDALGVSFDERRPSTVQRPSLREDASYAFALFGDASDRFRNSVVEQTIVSYLVTAAEPQDRSNAEGGVVEALQLAPDQAPLVSSAIDRMLQQGRLEMRDGGLAVDAGEIESFRVMRAVRERQWKDLLRDVGKYLSDTGLLGAGLERATDAVMERSGALMMFAATAASAAIGLSEDPAPIRSQLRKRLREVTAQLTAVGVPEHELDKRVRDVADLVSNSEIGRILTRNVQ